MDFKLHSKFSLMGDQKPAIEKLAKGIEEGRRHQTLMGVAVDRKSVV